MGREEEEGERERGEREERERRERGESKYGCLQFRVCESQAKIDDLRLCVGCRRSEDNVLSKMNHQEYKQERGK